MEEIISGVLLSFAQAKVQAVGGDFVVIQQSKIGNLSGSLMNIQQAKQGGISGSLMNIRQVRISPDTDFHFPKNAMTKRAFSLDLYIDGVSVNPCEMLNNLAITKSENQTAIAEFYLSQKCGVIDYFQYTGKRVEIYAVFENETKPLFKGWINTPEYDFYTKSIKFNATNEKIQQIANLDWNVINSIGYYSKRLFPDLETKDEIFNKRIESVKKSFFFDDDGNFHLFDWQPKPRQNADIVLDEINSNDCYFINNSMRFQGLKAAGVVNKINLTFQFQYPRKVQRNLTMRYQSIGGYGSTSNVDFFRFVGTYHFIPAPPVNSLVQAIKGAGWNVMSFSYAGLPDATEGWSPSIYQDYYATYAQWIAAKRWVQNCQENFEIAVKNQNSIDILSEKSEDIGFSLKVELSEDDDWQNEPCFTTTPSGNVGNGDFCEELSQADLQDYMQAFNYAFQVAQMKLYRSHRETAITGDIAFNADFQLGNTVAIDSQYFTGEAVITEFSHSFDFGNQMAISSLKGQWIENLSGDYEDLPALPSRPPLPVPSVAANQVNFGNVVNKIYSSNNLNTQEPISFCENAEDDNQYGYVMNEYIADAINPATVGAISAVKVAIKTPDIEKASTDALTAEKVVEYDFSILGNSPVLKLPC